MPVKKSENIFNTQEEILAYCGISRSLFQTYMEIGLPVRRIGGKYVAHKDNLDRFFLIITRQQIKDDFDNVE